MGPREREIRKLANAVLEETGPAVPVDPTVIAEQKGIDVVEVDLPRDIFGALLYEGSEFKILISRHCHGPGHRRFTVAHELGHYHIDGHLDRLLNGGETLMVSEAGHFRSQKRPEEKEADWFASELLVPVAWATPLVDRGGASLQAIQEIAGTAQVSLTCAGVRFAELSSEATAVVQARDGAVEWTAFSQRIREHAWCKRYWKKEWVPRTSATGLLAAVAEAVRRGEKREGAGLLCEWFEGAPPHIEVLEEVVGLGAYGRTLTLLSAPDLLDPEEVEEEEEEERSHRTGDWKDAMRAY